MHVVVCGGRRLLRARPHTLRGPRDRSRVQSASLDLIDSAGQRATCGQAPIESNRIDRDRPRRAADERPHADIGRTLEINLSYRRPRSSWQRNRRRAATVGPNLPMRSGDHPCRASTRQNRMPHLRSTATSTDAAEVCLSHGSAEADEGRHPEVIRFFESVATLG